jgi:hypothetical protein
VLPPWKIAPPVSIFNGLETTTGANVGISTIEFEPPEHPANETIPLARITNFNEFMFLMVRQIKVLGHAWHDWTMTGV